MNFYLDSDKNDHLLIWPKMDIQIVNKIHQFMIYRVIFIHDTMSRKSSYTKSFVMESLKTIKYNLEKSGMSKWYYFPVPVWLQTIRSHKVTIIIKYGCPQNKNLSQITEFVKSKKSSKTIHIVPQSCGCLSYIYYIMEIWFLII